MTKGEKNITGAQAKKTQKLARAIEDYEDNVLKVAPCDYI